jgi:hypothetical protein
LNGRLFVVGFKKLPFLANTQTRDPGNFTFNAK